CLTSLYGMRKIRSYDFDEIINNQNVISKVEITFESKFDDKVDIPEKLYHLSIMEYCDKIEKQGLVVKSKSKLSAHLDRIYLCKNIEDCEALIPRMLLYYSNEKDDNIYRKGKELFNKDTTPV